MASPGSALFSLQTKLVAAFVLVVLAALAIAGSVFVVVRRGEQEERELDRVIATSPSIFVPFSLLQERGGGELVLGEFAARAAEEFDVRVMLIDRRGGVVAADSGGELVGEELMLPDEFSVEQPDRFRRPYISFELADGSPGDNLIFVSLLPNRTIRPREFDRFALLLAVPESTIASAWQGLLPALGVAAAIAVPAAVLLAVIVARYISSPLYQLTTASQRMAEGQFDVRVSVDRRDEVGRLAQAFSTMARRVGEAHTQMRTLVANVSHDLKTPLTSILGFGQALRDGRAEDAAEVRRMGGVIYDEASRLATRLNDLLLLSELESGQTLLQREDIDLRTLLEGLVQRVERDTEARGVSVGLDLADGLVVTADGAKLERALENLIDNARKYTPSGGEIRIRAELDGGRAAIEVANTAPDLSPDELPRLFDRFYRRDRARAGASAASGSGLGLPIARDLIAVQGGTLEASLRDGELVFTAHLPTLSAKLGV